MDFEHVYFINGTAYAGKSTMVKLLAEKYHGIACEENYHDQLLAELNKDELYRLYITKTHLSILVIIPYLFYSTDIIMGCPIEILRIDRMMNIVKNSRFSRPS
ncbi:MAG TPA: hypothetical protein H9846_00080, partial [Candidatus Gemmiger excrementipullorum]|nr:hypothetical protein [Candidatus Gemmiger excrementipullorum]